jgi:hypothetical protein
LFSSEEIAEVTKIVLKAMCVDTVAESCRQSRFKIIRLSTGVILIWSPVKGGKILSCSQLLWGKVLQNLIHIGNNQRQRRNGSVSLLRVIEAR